MKFGSETLQISSIAWKMRVHVKLKHSLIQSPASIIRKRFFFSYLKVSYLKNSHKILIFLDSTCKFLINWFRIKKRVYFIVYNILYIISFMILEFVRVA